MLLNKCRSVRPTLSVLRSRSTMNLSWPFPSAGLVLQSASSLSPANWQTAAEEPNTNNGSLQVTVALDQIGRYFRLRGP